MIQVRNFIFSYPKHLQTQIAVPDFDLQKGESLFVYGPSGSGKTTFLECLAGVLTGYKGQIVVLDQDYLSLSPRELDEFRANHIGYIFQNFNLIPYLTVKQNILLPLEFSQPRKVFYLEQIQKGQDQLTQLCQDLGIESLLSQNVQTLSTGQQQRVAAARAFIGNPSIIIADEPTSALDQQNRQGFIELLFNLNKRYQSTLVFVSHDLSFKNLFNSSIQIGNINNIDKMVSNHSEIG